MRSLTLYVLLLCAADALAGADLAREQRMRAAIEDATLSGQAIGLRTGELTFLALRIQPRTAVSRGAVILAHDQGGHPDWARVIAPLRRRLPAHGWESLSIQMPVAAADAPRREVRALVDEAVPRLNFAVHFLDGRKISRRVVIGHGLGARMLAHWLASDPPPAVQAFVAVGLSLNGNSPDDPTWQALSRIRIPLLDIYGSRDLDGVLHSVQARADAARKARNSAYRQLEITGADHFFHRQDEQLVTRVRAWLARHFPADR